MMNGDIGHHDHGQVNWWCCC